MKEFSIIEKWKYTSTEEIIEFRNRAKKVCLLNTESVLFLIFLVVFVAPMISFYGKGLLYGITATTIQLLIYTPIWFFILRPKYVSQERFLEAKEFLDEMEIVLKDRQD